VTQAPARPLSRSFAHRRWLAGLMAGVGLLAGGALQAKPVAHHAAHPVAAAAPAPATPPKLLVAIAVDQFSADLFAQYRQHYSAGMARLLTGAVFPSGFQSHAATETCPGHSTLLTGVHPARSGIIANNWYDTAAARPDKRIYCAEDDHHPDSDSKNPIVSAVHLKVPTLGEMMKARWPESRNVAVSVKDRAVMMMGGHQTDAAYWLVARGFETYHNQPIGNEALDENASILALLNKGAPAFTPPAWCAPRDRAITTRNGAGVVPSPAALADGPTVVGKGRFALDAGDADGFKVSPRADAATLDLALRLVRAMKLGKGAAPDLLSVSLSATDYIGHAYGTEGMEMCIQQNQLDLALGAFFAQLDALGLDYAVVLTADHGGLDIPERLEDQADPAARRAAAGLSSFALNEDIARELGLTAFLPRREADGTLAIAQPAYPKQLVYAESAFGDYFITHELSEEQRQKVQALLVAKLKASPLVAHVWTKAEIASFPIAHGNPQDWTMEERVRASWDAQRSGDVFSVLKRTVVPIPEPRPGYTATHGSPWDYDRRVPMLFWRRGYTGFEQPQPVETVDIAPSLAALVGLAEPDGTFDGRCLDLDGGAKNTCEGAAAVPSRH